MGFVGVVFDKDNTITAPYSLSIWAPLALSVHQCKSLFGNNVAVFSNSAGNFKAIPFVGFDVELSFSFRCVFLCLFCVDVAYLVKKKKNGLYEYGPDGRKAGALEDAIGIKVVRHRVKKPAGTAEEIERHFGCKSSRLIMVGDRSFTDIVYGNRNGFFTILTQPLSLIEEHLIVRQVRLLEAAIVR
ncbi:haloacid dehalogenase (HAD) superfamily protein [Striga hermonthica]|uniref:Haloacid dehalogenase (HAD) superfamily protein n=1 Tax=Striga hermonthica TaxID=68872 RepID=A0A9N7MVW9_STRHE|nr:haloacid dehalogenase (HAD) superfamily protein [Striga hermonthica]